MATLSGTNAISQIQEDVKENTIALIEPCFLVVLFGMLYNVVLTVKSVHEILNK